MGRRAAAAAFVISAILPRQHRTALALKASRALQERAQAALPGHEWCRESASFFPCHVQCINSVMGSLKQAGKTLVSWFLLQEDGPVLPHVDLANLAIQGTL